MFITYFAEVSTKEIIALNHGLDPKNIQEKQTILIPAGKLSSRDKEILAGAPHKPSLPSLQLFNSSLLPLPPLLRLFLSSSLTLTHSAAGAVSTLSACSSVQHALLCLLMHHVSAAGIGPRSYRTYPVRSGEDITDIISKRGITREEVNALNPEVNLDRLSGNPFSTPQGRPIIISTSFYELLPEAVHCNHASAACWPMQISVIVVPHWGSSCRRVQVTILLVWKSTAK